MAKNILSSIEVFRQKLTEVYAPNESVFSAVSAAKVGSLKPAELIEYIEAFTAYLHKWGIRKGNRVITSLSHNIDWNIIEYSLLKLGAVHIPLAPNYLEGDLVDLIDLTQPTLFIANSTFHYNKLDRLTSFLGLQIPLIKFKPQLFQGYSAYHYSIPPVDISEDDTAVILFTSGSSNKSKAVVLSYKNILTSIKDFASNDIFYDCEICLDILHHSFSGGRKVNYAQLLRGKHICYANSTLSLTDNINLYKADLVTCVPYFANQILEYLKQKNELPSLRKIICGGAPISSELILSLREYGITLYNVYGLTETTSLCSYSSNINYKIGSAGKISSKIEYTINDHDELLLKGDSIFKGYLTKQGIQSQQDNDGWFNTGDVVKIDNEGFLFILGRNGSLIKTEKGKYY